jgi:hypothetical protein
MNSKVFLARSLSSVRAYLEIFKTFSFLKLFLSLFLLIIFPFALFISHFLYRNYKEALDWNYRFQLTRVQLMSIDLENHVRDQLLTQGKEKTHFWKGNLESLRENLTFKHCINLESDLEHRKIQYTFLFPCNYQNTPKNWILLHEGGIFWIYSAEFLEDLLLDSPFSKPNESIFLLNRNAKFGLSSQIETDFRIPKMWFDTIAIYSTEERSLPRIRDVEVEDNGYFLSSFPMYGLPFHLFVVSPKEIMLEPVRLNLIKNLLFLFLLLLFFRPGFPAEKWKTNAS